ncbi:MAG: HlyD family efflux transporter periplasmic adaptor subunit [Magnetococcales bacterium]|nr:HlyD family efflux transporter periplasmic adaptor subunit [Magnetococcales bacterium]
MTPLPPLREELHLFPGPRTRNRAPSWTIHDPASNHFFRIGWREFEILSRWHIGDADQVASRTREETPLYVRVEQVQGLLRFLTAHNLVRVQGQSDMARLRRQLAATQQSWIKTLFHAYLFFRVPLVRPDRFLEAVLPAMGWVFRRGFWLLMAAVTLTGLILVSRQWEAFFATLTGNFTLEGAILMGAAIFVSKVIHEFGHTLAAKRYGCPVPSVGVAFLVMWPVLYSDVTAVWKLADRKQRLAVGIAGVAAELVLASWATLLWNFLPDGPARSAAFFLATSGWVMTLTVNLSPFLRFDAYYLLSDWIEVQNLHARAGALGRWWLRELLLGLGDPDPEPDLYQSRPLLILFAYLSWAYRLVLFFSIALLVYHYFFKMLGAFLMMVEIGWFIFRPVLLEFADWWRLRRRLRLNRHTLVTALMLAGLLLLLFYPWSHRVEVPALLRPDHPPALYAPLPARLDAWMVARGDRVRRGERLAQLSAPDLAHKITQSGAEIALLRQQLALHNLHSDLFDQRRDLRQKLNARLAEYQGFLRQREQLALLAPTDGVVVGRLEHLRPGDWVGSNEPLLELADLQHWVIEAYVEEIRRDQVLFGGEGEFFPEMGDLPPLRARIVRIEHANTKQLHHPWLGSHLGGEIPTKAGSQGEAIPLTALYAVVLEPEKVPPHGMVHLLRGTVHLPGEPLSIADSALRMGRSLFIRESGF